MDKQIDTLLENIVADYDRWTDASAPDSPRNAERVNQFRQGLSVEQGRKYIKIISDSSVWGFIVAVDTDRKFRQGDILKAASWAAPARNAARGNILDGGYSIRWTGPEYLK